MNQLTHIFLAEEENMNCYFVRKMSVWKGNFELLKWTYLQIVAVNFLEFSCDCTVTSACLDMGLQKPVNSPEIESEFSN